MRLFGSDRLTGIVNALGLEEDQPIEHKMLSNAIENAQKRVEGKNFDIRKHVLQYDDVMNKQREVIYAQRKKVLDGESLKEHFEKMIEDTIDGIVEIFTGEAHPDNWDWEGMLSYAKSVFPLGDEFDFDRGDLENITKESVKSSILNKAMEIYASKEADFGSETMRELERVILLMVVAEKWMDHIDAMDQLRYGIGLRAYGQRDPVVEYKFEGFEMFEEMIRSIREEAVKMLMNIRINRERMLKREKVAEPVEASHGRETQKTVTKGIKVGRNAPCPCGSGKKYKRCCGMNEE